MREILFIILSSFLLNSCCINQMNILGLCTEPVEVPNAPLKEILSAERTGITINSHNSIGILLNYENELFCGCYKFGSIDYPPDGYKDKYWYVYEPNIKKNIKNYRFIVVESTIINGKNVNKSPDIIKELPSFVVIERSFEGKRNFVRLDFELETKPV